MPEDPFRLRLMKALCAQLKTITPDDGYHFDLRDYVDEAGRPAERVFRGRDIFGESDPLPMLAVLEDPRSEPSDNGSDGRGAANIFKVIIQGFVPDDPFHPLDAAYQLSADVTEALVKGKALGQHRTILGLGRYAPCVSAMTIGQPVHRPGNDGVSERAYMLIGVRFALIENLERPRNR